MKNNILHLLQVPYRNIRKNPVYSFISIFGFTLGIAATLLIYLWVNRENSFDTFHSDTDRIYRVLTLRKYGDKLKKSPSSYLNLARLLKTDYPQIEKATYLDYSSEDSPLQIEGSNVKIEARKLYVSHDFFNIFDGLRFVEGNAATALKNPNGIILNEITAKKLFGNQPALGKTIVSDKYFKDIYTVTAVVRVPKNSHIDFGYILPPNKKNESYTRDFRLSYHAHIYIKLAKNAVIDDSFTQSISNYITEHTGKPEQLLFQPLTDIHLHSDYETSTYDKHISSYKYVWIFSLLALLIIFMASFNFTMLETARSTERYKEVAVRKVNGASQLQLIAYGLNQSLLQAFISGALAYGLVILMLPFINAYISTDLHLIASVAFIIKYILFLLIIGVCAGMYPAFYAASFQPTAIFRGNTKTGGKKYLIQALVFVQFVIAICFITSTAFMIKQLNYMQNKDLGFDHSNILVVPTGLWYDNNDFKNELLKNPNVLSVTASVKAPINYSWERIFPVKSKGIVDSLRMTLVFADEDFAKTYNIKVSKGVFLDYTYSDYWKESQEKKDQLISIPMVINETAQKQMGIDNPIGIRINDYVIVGVVKDFHFRPLHHPIGAMAIINNPESIMTANIKIAPHNRAATISYVRDVYRKNRDERAFTYAFFDDMLKEEYHQEIRMKNLMVLFSIIAISISILGIMGMALFFIHRRTKEIGIRKVNGAKTHQILALFNRDFILWIIIAFVIAVPIVYYTIRRWFENFAYTTEINWWVFALSGLAALIVAVLTISWLSWRSASKNPVEALRYE